MDKNKIKSFAVWARRKMIESVTEKAERIGITKDNVKEVEVIQGGFKLGEEIFYLSYKDREALKHQIDIKGFEEVMEEVAYTWFNRFMGLRYMEVNDYLPSGIRILSSSIEGKVEPDVLSKVSDMIEELNLDGEEIYNLLDSGNTTDREKAYRIILVKQCNELGKIIPQMFEKISDYTELLLPDNLLEEGSVIRKMVEDIEESDWQEEVEIIGWMYQYYISEKKDEVFAALKKNVKITKENIPAATQLFTPKWIVKYMVENSLGRLWLEGHPNTELQSEWKYYLEEAEQEPEVEEELQKIREEHSKLTPEDIKVLDPCMGSGHILVYAFDVLYEIYKTAGYSEREIPRLILQNNLYGLDIDDRAAQLASFALIMKARHYNRRIFREIEREDLELNLCAIQESNEITEEVIDYFANGNEELKNDVKYLVDVFTDAKEYGSILEVKKVDFDSIKVRLKEVEDEDNLMFGDYRKIILAILPCVVKQGEIMSELYEVCITNPPYLGIRSMKESLKNYLNKNFKDSRSDLFAVFIEKLYDLTKKDGLYSMINQHSWMFLQSFEELRKKIVLNENIINMLHLGARAFEEIGGEVVQSTTFSVRKNKNKEYKSTYVRLIDYMNSEEKELKTRESIRGINKKNIFICKNTKVLKLPSKPLAYWANNRIFEIFNESSSLEKIAKPRQGMATTNNDLFLRKWFETKFDKIGFHLNSELESIESEYKWFPYNKGGEFRKWYGNNEYIVNFEDGGKDVCEYIDKHSRSKVNHKGRVINREYYFKESITWSFVSSTNFGVRYCSNGFIFDIGGSSVFPEKKDIYYILAMLCSKLSFEFLKMQNPTLNFQVGNIANIPLKIVDNNEVFNRIVNIAKINVNISKMEWDSFETSWDFKVHPLLKSLDIGSKYKLNSIFNIWKTECEENFKQLKSNEEELNKIFIDIYGLQNELTPEVEDKDITIRKADRERDIKSLISYAVGCMLGRYSINAEGLIYAGGEFNEKWLFNNEQCKVRSINKDADGNVISDKWVDATFIPDKDNIIPITEDEYFEDDIVSRFIEFIRTVYGEENLEENLDYIAESIGRKSSESSRQAIRRYFIKDFYKDHLKIYQKRPIYWMFDSGKNDGFKCLIYMHRYNDQTVAKVRTDYLHVLQRKYEAEINRQQLVVDSGDSSIKDKTIAKKKIDRINKQIEECREYDEIVAYIANEKISIDLDDGVKVNYAEFQNIKMINSKGKEVKMNLLAKI